MNTRDFIKTLAGAGAGLLAAGTLSSGTSEGPALPISEPEESEAFWASVRAGYDLDPARINLESGYYSLLPRSTFDACARHAKDINQLGSYYMRTRQADDMVRAREGLATFLGCSAEEVVVTRNTTESLDTIVSSLDWKAGDEAVMAEQDYASMLTMFDQQALRYRIVNKVVSLPNDPSSDEEIVDLYRRAIAKRTRLLMVCHIVNITGQILPVRKIADMARERGVLVMVDGAHSFAHLDFKLAELGCDYYATSLHKWLGAPLGTGLLYVRKDLIPSTWPLLGDTLYPRDDVRKLNHIGTNPMHNVLTIADALALHQRIGPARKERRLRFLKEYWTRQVRGHSGIVLNTPSDPRRACAIANVGLDRVEPDALMKVMLEKYRIWTVGIDNPKARVRGIRVTPNLFTTLPELDALVGALKALA